MDEATSSLDSGTEKEIIESVNQLKGNRTIIMIAHRLTTVKNCDCLYFLKEGRLDDAGTYNELFEKKSSPGLRNQGWTVLDFTLRFIV